MIIDDLLRMMMEKSASDLHLKAGRPPLARVAGKILPLELERLKPDEVKNLIYSIMSSEQRQLFEQRHELDMGYSIPGLSRFRANVFYQRGTVEAVLRAIPFEVPTVDDLGLPDVIKDLCLKSQGLILVTGPTGSGKTTTLASMIEYINRERACHIITIEEPIEFLFRDKKSSISQREVGYDTYSYADALKYVLRQDPDIILIAEIRDQDTTRTAIRAAETGHLVLATLHTYDAPGTIDRLISYFPAEEQQQIRIQLSILIEGIISQRLLRTADGKGRIAAVEIMTKSPQIQKLIEEGKIPQIHDTIAASVTHFKMQTLNQSLVALTLSGAVAPDEAVLASNNPDEFKRVLHDFQVETTKTTTRSSFEDNDY